MDHRKSLIAICWFLGESSSFAVPQWAQSNATKMNGRIFQTVCSGVGPSVDLARGEAIRGCKSSAADMLQDSGTVRSMVIETNQEVAFHQSIEDSIKYRGLRCDPLKEAVEEAESGRVQVWLLCRFDLSKASVGEEREPLAAANRDLTDKVEQHMTRLKDESVTLGRDKVSEERMVLNVASVPPCRQISVRGARPRVVPCSGHPAAIVIFPGDETLLIDAKGYMPKSLNLRSKKWKNHDSIQVILENR